MMTEDGILYVAGQIGWNNENEFESSELAPQVGQALRNVVEVVETAGGSPTDIVRLTWYLTDRRQYMDQRNEIGKVYRAVMGMHFPAMSVVVVRALLEERAVVEIEATAAIPPVRVHPSPKQ